MDRARVMERLAEVQQKLLRDTNIFSQLLDPAHAMEVRKKLLQDNNLSKKLLLVLLNDNSALDMLAAAIMFYRIHDSCAEHKEPYHHTTCSQCQQERYLNEILASFSGQVMTNKHSLLDFIQTHLVPTAAAPPPPATSPQSMVMSTASAIARLSTVKGLEHTSPEYKFAMSMMENPVKREVLGCLRNDLYILDWVKHQYQRFSESNRSL